MSQEKSHYIIDDLKKFATVSSDAPEIGQKFFDWYASVFEDGALSKREKSLMALAVALAVQCPYCIDAYTNESLKLGVSPAAMTEAAHVASAIKGGAALVHGVQMKNIIDKKMMR